MIDVAITGAGVSGLAAAASLHRSGLSIEVIEARDRIGGRVHTVQAPAVAASRRDLMAARLDAVSERPVA